METLGILALMGIVLSAAILLIEFSETLIKAKLADSATWPNQANRPVPGSDAKSSDNAWPTPVSCVSNRS